MSGVSAARRAGSPARIAILVPDAHDGPFATIASCLATGFREHGVPRCDVVTLAAAGRPPRSDAYRVVDLDRRARFCGPRLARYLRREAPDVLFVMPWYLSVIAIAAGYASRARTLIVPVEQNVISLESGIEHVEIPRFRYLPPFMRIAYPRAAGVVGCSRDVLEDLTRGVGIRLGIPTAIIPNPVDAARVRALARQPPPLAPFAGEAAPLIVTTARFARQKALDVLIRAFARVRSVMPANLWLMGDGPLRGQLEALCRELRLESSVAMPGYQPNPYPALSSCAVFVLASAWEGSSMVLREAMACGAAVIVSDAPGDSREVVGHGEYGMVVTAGDPEKLADAIRELLTSADRRAAYRKKSLERIDAYQPGPISAQYLEFYDRVSRVSSPPPDGP